MDERLVAFYNSELRHVREMAAEFAREFPKIAGRLALDRDAKFGAQPVRLRQHVGGAEHDLCNAGRIPQIDEDDAAVVAAASHPTGQDHLLPGVATPQRTSGVAAQHKHSPLTLNDCPV